MADRAAAAGAELEADLRSRSRRRCPRSSAPASRSSTSPPSAPGVGVGLAVEPAPAPAARAAARRPRARSGRLRRRPPLPGADPRAHGPAPADARLVPAADVARRAPAAALARSAPFDARCSSPGSSPRRRSRPDGARTRRGLPVGPMVYLAARRAARRAERGSGARPRPRPPRGARQARPGRRGSNAAARAATERLGADPGLQLAALQSSIGRRRSKARPGTSSCASIFPIAKYFRAFDFGVFAAGYNVFHEVDRLRLPTLFVPMPRDTDDQAARAGWACSARLRDRRRPDRCDRLMPELGASLADPATRSPIGGRCAGLEIPDGAGADGEELEALARGRSGGGRAERAVQRWLRLSAPPVGPSLPWAGIVTARELWCAPRARAPEARRPRPRPRGRRAARAVRSAAVRRGRRTGPDARDHRQPRLRRARALRASASSGVPDRRAGRSHLSASSATTS